MTVAGNVQWPPEAPVWKFSWQMVDGDSEAIAFYDLYFKDRLVLHKASLPMIRVQYDGPAGPYKDQLSTGNMRGSVTVHEGSPSPTFRFLVVESYHEIGHYRLTNRWIFRNDGIILPQLYSAGLQAPYNHRHHAYWRFDFDVVGAANNLALEHLPVGTDWGWGPGWLPYTVEAQAAHSPRNTYAVLNKSNPFGHLQGYTIAPGPFDGAADAFGRLDAAVTAYRGPEDLRGRLGTPSDDQIATQVNGENIDGKDVVLWWCAHLDHHASEGGDEWHVCGPILQPFGYP
ncbi:hypothetical protein [Kitasatospora phosalacinea]|uniref:Copper amine oxidase catalytic domain-containing protein n=1 Tax=Kitasatospora phosalacinea TaxID=2065 RepID=A0A0M3N1A5_9ACTN|nr:hypothetical protein [Kitasatospora phosalacinea]AKO69632.1 hypothetical protein [Kitasatospora phosalacinea]